MVLCPGAPVGSTGGGSGVKHLRRCGHSFKVSSVIPGEPGIKLGTPGYKASGLPTTPWQLISPFVSNFGIQ